MAADKASTPETIDSNYQDYFVQEYGVTVKARTAGEAVEKAKKLAKDSK